MVGKALCTKVKIAVCTEGPQEQTSQRSNEPPAPTNIVVVLAKPDSVSAKPEFGFDSAHWPSH
jgi:hypothetical protein